MKNDELAAQLRLAADILETGHPWEHWHVADQVWEKANEDDNVVAFASNPTRKIRLMLARPPCEAELYNPDNLTAEQVGVGYRLCLKTESSNRICEAWVDGKWINSAPGNANYGDYAVTHRLSLTVSWPEQKPAFQLPTPPPGMQWHRTDGWTAEMLPQGYRPICLGEVVRDGEHEAYCKVAWITQRISQESLTISEAHSYSFLRTTRPLVFTHEGHEWTWHRAGDPMPCDGERKVCLLRKDREEYHGVSISGKNWDWVDPTIIGWRYADAEKPDPYAELKKAHAEGKVIQFNPVPLGPEDVLPGSVIDGVFANWNTPISVTPDGVYLLSSTDTVEIYSWSDLLNDKAKINRSIPLTGKWNPDAWEPCSKEADA